MNPLDGPLPAEGGVHSPEGVRRIRALRFSHSAVVTAWRQREREMLGLGADVALATARSWNEGGKVVSFEAGDDEFALSARTLGTHPSVFVFDPRPIWKLMGRGDWDVFDFHEEPGSLAVGELLVLRWLDMFRRRRREPRHKGTGEAPGTRRAGRIPFTFYSAQNIPKHYPPPFRWIERRALKTAGGAYVCNEAAGDILLRKGMQGIVEVLPLGVDLDHFSAVEREVPSDPLRVGFVGRLTENKGVDVLLRAARREPGIVVEIAGAGPAQRELEELTRRLGIENRVIFRGFADQADLPDLYHGFDVLAVPSLPSPRWVEQFCRVAVEAMACGVPVVASNSGALPEVVGDAGVIFPPGDDRALALALRTMSEQQALWRDLRKKAIDRAPRFAWRVVASGHLDLYERILSENADRASDDDAGSSGNGNDGSEDVPDDEVGRPANRSGGHEHVLDDNTDRTSNRNGGKRTP